MTSVRSQDGTTIAYDRVGSGPPLIIVGGAFSYRRWKGFVQLAELLGVRFTAVNYDRRGRGDSTDARELEEPGVAARCRRPARGAASPRVAAHACRAEPQRLDEGARTGHRGLRRDACEDRGVIADTTRRAPAPPDRRLLDAARGGDDEAFRRLIEPYERMLHAHCYRMLGSLQDAEDALQDALLRAWRGLATFDAARSLRPWLYRIATNACLDLIAKRPARVTPIDRAPPSQVEQGPGRPLSEVAWLEPYPDAISHWFRGRDAVVAFIAGTGRVPLHAITTTANGQPVAAWYLRAPGADALVPASLEVLALAGDRVIEITAFVWPALFERFGLPRSLPR